MDKTVVTDVMGVASVTDKNGAVTETQEKLGLVVFEGPITQVTCELGYTMNLGNYQSARFHVALTAPSNLDHEALDKTFTFVKTWCENKLTSLLEEAKKELG